MPFVAGVRAAREAIVARGDEERETFLRKRGFSEPETDKIIATVLDEEGRPPESVFDFVQGTTALARNRPHQDARLELESRAAKLLDSVAWTESIAALGVSALLHPGACVKTRLVSSEEEVGRELRDGLEVERDSSPPRHGATP